MRPLRITVRDRVNQKEERMMRKRGNTRLLVLGFACLALVMSGCGRAVVPEASAAQAEEQETAEKHEDAHEEELPVGDLTVEQVLEARCPHGLTIECDECRYEVGVVKVDASLVNAGDGTNAGLVKTSAVPAKRQLAAPVNITGEVRLNENTEVHVSPRIPGVVRKVNVDIGADVKEGDVLFTMDSVELGEALSDYEKNKALAALSQKNYRREKSLFDQKIGAEIDMIEAQMQYEEYQTAQKASEQRLHVLGLSDGDIAAINSADEKSLSGALAVRAPISGTVIEKHAVIGELVGPEKGTMIIADLSAVWVWGTVYERDLDAVIRQQAAGAIPVEITVPAYPGVTFRGEMNYVGATMDEATRTVQVRTVVDNGDRRLRPGMFCQAKIFLGSSEDVLAVPKEAVFSDEGTDFVFTHMKDDYYLRQNVKKGREFEDGVEILDGLKPGQTIVTDGAFVLKSDVLRSKMGAGCAD